MTMKNKFQKLINDYLEGKLSKEELGIEGKKLTRKISKSEIELYETLIENFLENATPTEQFVLAFQEKFLNDEGQFNHPMYFILQNLFEDTTAYSPLWTEEDENNHQITEETLRKCSQIALEKLRKLKSEHL